MLLTINLKGSLGFFDDTARDTIHALEIIKHREWTLIGPPLSIGLFSIREIYFGSLSLYIAAIGLIVGRMDVAGAIYPTIFFFTVSIYFFSCLLIYLTPDKNKRMIALILYALSPVTVTFARFFWNPNLIIPFSVFYWLLLIRRYSSKTKRIFGFVLAGVISGVMVNFHYVSLFIVGFSLFYYLVKRKLDLFLSILTGFIIGMFPLILFELKHQFYLSHAFIYNMTQKGPVEYTGNKLFHFFSGIIVTLGLKPAEIIHPTIFNIDSWLMYPVIVLLIILIAKSFHTIKKDKRFLLIPLLLINLTAVYMSHRIYNVHYLFPIYPLLIWYISELLTAFTVPVLTYIVLLFMTVSTLLIPYDIHNIKKDYLSVAKIEEISNYIVHDNPTPPYNLTENITGGAQAIPFRFVLERDAKVLPNDKVSYTGLKTLYVVTPDIRKTYKENRYEFYATPNKILVKTVNFGDVNLYKFKSRVR